MTLQRHFISMKIAIFLRGERRTHDIQNIVFDNIIKNYPCLELHFYYCSWNAQLNRQDEKEKFSYFDEEYFLNYLNSLGYDVKFVKLIQRNIHQWSSPFITQMYCSYICNREKRIIEQNNNFIYDCVFSLRPDVYFNFRKFSELIEFYSKFKNINYVLAHPFLSDEYFGGLYFSDYFFISSSLGSDIISNFITELICNREKNKYHLFNCDNHGAIGEYLLKKNFSFFYDINFKMNVIRDNVKKEKLLKMKTDEEKQNYVALKEKEWWGLRYGSTE